MKITYNKKEIDISVKKVSELGKITGLMFKKKNTSNLLFEFKENTNMRIHSLFVFFKFLAIWTNSEDKIIDYKIVNPFTLSIKPKRSFRNLIEIPLNQKNKKIVEFFVGRKRFIYEKKLNK